MANWGFATWIGFLLLFVIALIYFKGFEADTSALSTAFGNTAKNIIAPVGIPMYA